MVMFKSGGRDDDTPQGKNEGKKQKLWLPASRNPQIWKSGREDSKGDSGEVASEAGGKSKQSRI